MITFKQYIKNTDNIKKKIKSNKMLKYAIEILSLINKKGHEAYIVGGAVRDLILDTPIHDVDLTTNMPINKLEDIFKNNISDIGKSKSFGIVTVKYKGFDYEIAQFRQDSYVRPKSVRKILDN